MLLSSLLAATLAAAPAPAADPSVALARLPPAQTAVFLGGTAVAALAEKAAAAAGALKQEAGSPLMPLDAGGAVSGDTRRLVGLLLAVFIGFGTGHLVVGDSDGFVLFLIVDLAIVVASSLLWGVARFPLGYLALVISHLIQAVDVWQKGGGGRIVEQMREKAVEWVAAPGREGLGVTTTRAFALHF